MKFIILLSLISLALGSDVIDLSGPDFDERIKELDTALVEFFAPWCGHCKRLAPKYEEAATILKKHDPPIPLVKVDCTSEEGGKATCDKYGVSGFPTLKLFRSGEFATEYNSGRETDAIVKYMKSQVGPSSKLLTTVEEVTKLLESGEVVIIGFFSSEGSELEQEFLKTADKLRESIIFAHTHEPALLEKYGYSDAIVLFRPKHLHNKFEPSEVPYDHSGKLEQFIKTSYHGLVGVRTQDNYNDFGYPLVIAYYDVDYVKNPKGTNYWRNRIMKVAQDFKDSGITFVIANRDKFSAEIEDFGLDSSVKDKPLVALKDSQQKKYKMEDEFSMDSLRKFLEDFQADKLVPHLKSEEVPESNDGPVKVAVAKNFQELVMDSDKDVLIEFYAPWCGHCKKLAPTYEELGTTLADEDIEIVKMDATANDVPAPFEVHGFPTLYFLPKDSKSSPKRYEGGRELSDFIKYLAKHATTELKGYDRAGKKKKTEL